MGRCKSWSSLKSFLWYAPHLFGANVFFTFWVSSGFTVGRGCSPMAARRQAFFPSWVPSGLTSSPSVVAAIADDCGIICLLIFHFSCSYTCIFLREIQNSSLYTYGHQFESRQCREGWLHKLQGVAPTSSPTLCPTSPVLFAFLQRLSSWILKAWGLF